MNIQEMQFISREKLPIKIILINNESLGMIRHFQEMYFESNYAYTVKENGYKAPNFEGLMKSFDIDYLLIDDVNKMDLIKDAINSNKACFIDIQIGDKTYIFPKLAINKPIHDQDPLMDRNLFNKLSEL